jgi:hypothetical protein
MGLLAMVLFVSPEPVANWVTFFVLLFLAMTGTSSLVAYWLSFRIYDMRRFHGDLGRAVLQGGAVASFVTVIALLQGFRVLNWWMAVPLVIILGLVQFMLRPRRTDSRQTD